MATIIVFVVLTPRHCKAHWVRREAQSLRLRSANGASPPVVGVSTSALKFHVKCLVADLPDPDLDIAELCCAPRVKD